MLTTKLDVTFSMVWTLAFANIAAAVLLMLWANQLQRIIFIPAHLVVPAIALFVFMGSWTAGNNIGDWIVLIVFGIIGVLMKQAGWPRPPLVLGYILGRIMENSLHLTIRAYGPFEWMLRPICIAIGIVVIVTIFFAIRSHMRGRKDPSTQVASDADEGNPRLSLIFSCLVFVVLSYAIVESFFWPELVRLFPLVFSIPGVLLAAAAIWYDRAELRAAIAAGGAPKMSLSDNRDFMRSIWFFVWLIGVLVLTILFGQHATLPAFMALYLVVWGRYRWRFALIYAFLGLLFLMLMFDVLSPTLWYPAVLFDVGYVLVNWLNMAISYLPM
jgi:hypothetical protein